MMSIIWPIRRSQCTRHGPLDLIPMFVSKSIGVDPAAADPAAGDPLSKFLTSFHVPPSALQGLT